MILSLSFLVFHLRKHNWDHCVFAVRNEENIQQAIGDIIYNVGLLLGQFCQIVEKDVDIGYSLETRPLPMANFVESGEHVCGRALSGVFPPLSAHFRMVD